MYIVIAGGGIVGFNIASILAEEQHDVVVIEKSEASIALIRRQLDVRTVIGNAATPRILKEVEVDRADLLLAVTNNDETNMVICFMAKELGATRTAARIRNAEYSGYFLAPTKSPLKARKIVRPKSLGIDVFINPEVEIAAEILSILSSFYSTPVEHFANGLVQVREFKVEDDRLANKKISELKFLKPCVIAAIVRSGEILIPEIDETIKKGDSVHLLAPQKCMNELGEVFSQPQRPARSVAILGGNRIGELVAEGLVSQGIDVKIIEKDLLLSESIAAKIEKAMVLNGDGTDRDFLIGQGIPKADAYVATTDNDEFNILSGLLVKTLGVPRCLTIINHPNNMILAEAAGLDVAGSPTILTARKIAHYVLSGGAISVALLEGKKLEAVEFVVSPEAGVNGKSFEEITLPHGAIAGAIVRNERIIIPPAAEKIKTGDHVIITTPLQDIHAVEKLFK
jgi:trk system potassium uptake protein TrkA